MASISSYGAKLRQSATLFEALREYPAYRRYWLGNLASVSAQQMMWITQGWLIYDLTGSTAYLGLAGLVSALPAIALNLVGGVVADRFDQRRVITLTQIGSAALVFILATLTATGVVQPWHILAAAFVTGALQAFNNPARQSIFPHLIDRKDLMKAISLNSMVWQGTRIIAPALGGVSVAAFGASVSLYISSVGLLALAFAVSGVHLERGEGRAKASMLQELGVGLAYIRSNFLFTFLIGMTFFNSFFGVSMLQLLPAFAEDILDIGPSGLGMMYSAGGIGSLLGIAVIGSLTDYDRKGLLIIGGATAYGVAVLVFAASPLFAMSLVALFFMGLFQSIFTISIQTALQMRVPDELRGRVMGVYGMTYHAGPLGALQAGLVASALGPQIAVAIGAVFVIAFSLGVASMNQQVRRLQSPAAAA